MQYIIDLVNHYGYIILYISLVLELIAFPLPGELMMTYFGFLVYQNKMNWFASIFVAAGGAITGITMSYWLGSRLGAGFFKRHGHYFHLGPERLEKTSRWFNNYGSRLLILAYFIPGVRHITGYFSGITKISCKKFALTAYSGAVLWAATFISLGKILGSDWQKFHVYITRYLIIGSTGAGIIIVIVYYLRNNWNRIIDWTNVLLHRALESLRSLRRIKAAMIVTAAAFLCFFFLLIGVIQDYLAHEFQQFDIIASYLVRAAVPEEWYFIINEFKFITTAEVLIPLTIIVTMYIFWRNRNRILEIRSLLIVVCGGELLQFTLRSIFRRFGPTSINAAYTFPSSEAFMTIAAYGFYAFIIIRHEKKIWIRTILVSSVALICIFAGINPIFFQTEYPSDIYAGYIFGGVWVIINIILLEIYRLLPG